MNRVGTGALAIVWVLAAFSCREDVSPGGAETSCVDGVDNDGDGDTDCADADCVDAPACVNGFVMTLYSEDLRQRGVDILLVLDNSGGTEGTQSLGRWGVSTIISKLRDREEGVPDLHVGVVTTDLGAAGMPITYCEEADGDAGDLITRSCIQPLGVPYIVDLRPEGCLVERAVDGECVAHDCTQAGCARDPNTILEEDSRGCPRCRNCSGQSLWAVLECIGNLGHMGCGFEQPLEAMYRALDNNPHNIGFLRDDAHLVVVLAADEDDCSVADPYFFDMSDMTLESELGPLTSYRCFEWGVTCDIDDRLHEGVRENCSPREDPEALLHPITRYEQFLRNLKWDDDVTVAVIGGPVENNSVVVRRDDEGLPGLATVSGNCGATPGVRLKAFAETMNDPQDWWWAFSPECVYSPVEPFEAAGDHVLDSLGDACAPAPPAGCTDVAVAFGLPGDGRDCNDACLPTCSVTDVLSLGLPSETETEVVPCLEVCLFGPCPGNTDPFAAYDQGHPAALDPSLPVSACWQITYEPRCVASNGVRVLVSRAEAMPPRSLTHVTCLSVTSTELLCSDGQDNDGDCLVDLEDPDCAG
jgi:hypothetical protein